MAAVTGHYDWEGIASDARGFDMVERMRVPGGWLYRNTIASDDHNSIVVTITFVPVAGGPFPSSNAGVEQH